jgi:hypothetical protein
VVRGFVQWDTAPPSSVGDVTSRCSCPLRWRIDQCMQSGISIDCRIDAAGQLNSMLSGPRLDLHGLRMSRLQ